MTRTCIAAALLAVAPSAFAQTPLPWVAKNRAQEPASAISDEPEDFDIAEDVQIRHGFRVGYTYLESELLSHPHVAVMGYEAQQTLPGGDALRVMFAENILIAGLNHSLVAPSVNALFGVEAFSYVHLGTGANVSFLPDPAINMVVATGVSIPIEEHYEIPVDIAWIAEPDGIGRIALTTGVNWRSKANN